MPEATRLPVSESDRRELRSWLRAGTTRKSHAERARIVLLSAEGLSAEAIAAQLGVVRLTVYKWRARYRRQGFAGLKDLPRPGQPRKMTLEKGKQILDWTTHRVPREATHWSLALMAKYAGVTRWQVEQVWKAADPRPHRIKSFKISNDPRFSEKVIDVVGLYLNPPDNAVVLSVDEKTQIQALDRTQPMLPLRPGQVERRTHDYKRHGTASLYAAFNIATGDVLGRITEQHRAKEFLDFLKQIDRAHAQSVELHLILDKSSAHKTPDVNRWLEAHPRFKLHFTPTSASWLNAVEIRRYIDAHNLATAKPFVWTKSAESILAAVDRAKRAMGTTQMGH